MEPKETRFSLDASLAMPVLHSLPASYRQNTGLFNYIRAYLPWGATQQPGLLRDLRAVVSSCSRSNPNTRWKAVDIFAGLRVPWARTLVQQGVGSESYAT